MPLDVVKKVYSTRAQHNGYAVVSAGMTNYGAQSGIFLRPRNHYAINESGISNKYDNRFDDVRYYEGDTAA
jgi:hypothetical protein